MKKIWLGILASVVVIGLYGAMAQAQQFSKAQRDAVSAADAIEKELTSMSDKIWTYAEIAMEEFKSTKLITDYLKRKGGGWKRTRRVCPPGSWQHGDPDHPSWGSTVNWTPCPGFLRKDLPIKIQLYGALQAMVAVITSWALAPWVRLWP